MKTLKTINWYGIKYFIVQYDSLKIDIIVRRRNCFGIRSAGLGYFESLEDAEKTLLKIKKIKKGKK